MKRSGAVRRRPPRGRWTQRRYRRYEITVPTTDNDGNPFHPERLNTVILDLNALSGGYTRLPVKGGWQGGPEEANHLFIVDVPDTPRAKTFFRIYRALLQARFGQDEIYLRSYSVAGVSPFRRLRRNE